MFAKLKKRVQGEEVEGASVHGGTPSPSRRDQRARREAHSTDSPGRLSGGRDSIRSSKESINSDISTDQGSKEELMRLLLKRTEQVKKMEGKVTELSTLVRERNREIDKLEQTLEKQQDENESKVTLLNEQYQVNRAKMADGFTLALTKKDESKAELSTKLEKAEQMKSKIFQLEEENDEVQNFTTQELYKVKHMLLLRQKELTTTNEELKLKTDSLEEKEKSVVTLNEEIQSLMQQITQITQTSEQTTIELRKYENQCEETMVEKASLESCLTETQSELSHKVLRLRSLEESYTQLQDDYRTLNRNSELSQQKMSALLEEKDNEIDEQKERLGVLAERVNVNSASSDDARIQGIEKERTILENKLTEARHQLKEVKTSWSDKITHLEKQISHLNNKIAEDSDELSNCQRRYEADIVELKQHVSELENKLQVAESQAANSFDLAKEKDSVLQKQEMSYEEKLQKQSQRSSDIAADLTTKISQLEQELEQQKKAHQTEVKEYKGKICTLEQSEEDWLEKEIDTERKLSQLEEQVHKYKSSVESKDKDMNVLRVELRDRQQQLENLRDKALVVEEEKKRQELEIESLNTKVRMLQAEYKGCVKEKDTLLLRNAELSQKFESYKKESADDKVELKKTMKSQETAISGLEQSVQDMQEEITQQQQKIKILETERTSGVQMSEELNRVKTELTDTESQLQDKTKTIKMQQQRLSDLKKTLQRELKVQALPNDEPVTVKQDTADSTKRSSSPTLNPNIYPGHVELASMSNGNHPHISTSSSIKPLEVPITVRSNGLSSHKRTRSALSLQQGDRDEGLTLWQDTNFEYLKHVVLKFVLSREHESLQLIRAIATLLKLSPQEQKLCQETLKWKTSWFGSRPKLGEGQKAKYIPPS